MPMRSFDEIIKDGPTVGEVHINSASRRRRAQMSIAMISHTAKAHGQTEAFAISVPIIKVNDELRTVYGWASVNTEKGSIVTDHQDDQVDDAEIIKAAHDFMTNSRVGGLLHARGGDGMAHQGGDIVESVVFTPDVQK